MAISNSIGSAQKGSQPYHLIGGISALAAVFSWSLSGMIIKMGLSQIEPACHVFLRLSVASLIVGIFWYFNKSNSLKLLRGGPILMGSFILLVLVNTFIYTYAIKGVPYSWYVILFSFQPVFALSVMDPQTLLRKSGLGVLIAVMGVLLFVETATLSTEVSIWNLLLVFFAMSLWTGYTLLVNRLNRYYTGTEIALVTVVTGMLGALAMIFFIHSFRGIDFVQVYQRVDVLKQIVLTGILTSLVYGLYSTGIRLVPSLAVVIQYLDPLMGCLLAVALLDEKLTYRQWLGGLLILCGIYLTKKWMKVPETQQSKGIHFDSTGEVVGETRGEVYG